MASRDHIFNTALAAMVAITVWSLWSLGESRLDVYTSLYTLEYLVAKAVLRPRRAGRDWLLAALVASFFAAVSTRIYSLVVGP